MLTKNELNQRANEMRPKPTYCERIFRDRLIYSQITFRNQKVIGHYIVDFCVGQTIIEIDGESHTSDRAIIYDQKRTDYLRSRGYEVVRIFNSEVGTVDIKRLLKINKKDNNQNKPNKFQQHMNKTYKGGYVNKKLLGNYTSKHPLFKTLNWNSQKYILQRERLHGC